MANQQTTSDVETHRMPAHDHRKSARETKTADGPRKIGETANHTVETIRSATRDVTDDLKQNAENVTRDAAKAGILYRDTASETMDRMQALMSSFIQLTRGAQEVQHTFWEVTQQSFRAAISEPTELAQCRSLTEFAEKQR
ncbi:MAG: hypothetical protein JWM91_4482, partial [Rhodospirillales bacterium]|nr:hypothetical protein [Rhodospirillales bacterium]